MNTVTTLQDLTTPELVAQIKQMLAERKAQFQEDYLQVKVGA